MHLVKLPWSYHTSSTVLTHWPLGDVAVRLVSKAVIIQKSDFTNEMSTLLQAMAWCYQALNHYFSQCWPRSMSLYGIIVLQYVNSFEYWHMKSMCTQSSNEMLWLDFDGLVKEKHNSIVTSYNKPSISRLDIRILILGNVCVMNSHKVTCIMM